MNTQLEEKFFDSPRDIQLFLIDENLGPAITLACSEVGVDANTALSVEDIVVDILLGTTPPKELLEKLHDLSMPEDTAKKLAKKLIENIFSQIGDSIKKTHHIDKDLYEEMVGEKIIPVRSLADDVLGTHKKAETGSVLIKPEVEGLQIQAAKEALSTAPSLHHDIAIKQSTPNPTQAPATPPKNLPGVSNIDKETILSTINPAPEHSSAYPIPPVASSEKKGPSDEATSDIKIPENIFEAKLRQVSESLEGSVGQSTSNQVPKPPKQDPSADPYREPLS